MSKLALLHLYAGTSFHVEGYIVGNREGLTQLRDALNKALEGEDTHRASVTDKVFVSDGEAYDVFVIRQDTEEPWQRLIVPYTSEDGLLQIQDTDIWPRELISNTERVLAKLEKCK